MAPGAPATARRPEIPVPKPLSTNHVFTSRYPPGTLDRIARTLGASTSELSTLCVPASITTLYFAITEYAAIYTPAESSESSESSEPSEPSELTPKPPVPLRIDYNDRCESAFASEESSDDEEPSEPFLPHRLRKDRPIRKGKGVGKRKAEFLKFKLGLGEFTIVWPPPPHLEPESVAARRLLQCQVKTKKKKKTPTPPTETALQGDVPKPDDSVVAKEKPTEPPTPPFTVLVFHYTSGQPHFCERSERYVAFREILLVTKASTLALQTFTNQIMQWRIDKDHREGGPDKYPLHRFKTEGAHGWWENEGLKRARPIESVVLADGQVDAIMEDVHKFLTPKTRRWYTKFGLPHRRSLLFYGPPGTGKTSTIRAMASMFRLSCCFLSMTDATFSNQMLADALSQIPPNALLVLEDVDALFNLDRKNEGAPSLTFSGLLNALDGVISVDGVITIMTTNHLERLDRALVRGGRVDRRFYFGLPNKEQLIELFTLFYPDAETALAKKFANKVMDRAEGMEVRSIATLQQLFIHMREEPAEECVEAMDEFFRFHFPGDLGGMTGGLYV